MPLIWGFVMVLIKTNDLLNVYTEWYWNCCDWPAHAWRPGRTRKQPQQPEDQCILLHTCATCQDYPPPFLSTRGPCHKCHNKTVSSFFSVPLGFVFLHGCGIGGAIWRLKNVSWIWMILGLLLAASKGAKCITSLSKFNKFRSLSCFIAH